MRCLSLTALMSLAGISAVLEKGATHQTSDIRGTVAFMAPEVFEQGHTSPAMDIYALGVLSERCACLSAVGVPPVGPHR